MAFTIFPARIVVLIGLLMYWQSMAYGQIDTERENRDTGANLQGSPEEPEPILLLPQRRTQRSMKYVKLPTEHHFLQRNGNMGNPKTDFAANLDKPKKVAIRPIEEQPWTNFPIPSARYTGSRAFAKYMNSQRAKIDRKPSLTHMTPPVSLLDPDDEFSRKYHRARITNFKKMYILPMLRARENERAEDSSEIQNGEYVMVV